MTVGEAVAKVTADTKDFTNKMDSISEKTSSVAEGASKAFKGVGSVITTVGKIGLGAIATAVTSIAAVTTAAVKAYADYEQLTGGVVKLFGDMSDEVIANAEQAYTTAGMSANDYMDTVTSFSASLLHSLGKDTSKAAGIADKAIRDMSDNANTFGTDISLIQNAYQGFAKGNFTMLDNLKLGYGGTATEMARLLNESGVLGKGMKATAENVNSIGFDKYIEAIHTVQEEMNITGTTAKEAAKTISGSISSAKAAWTNLLTTLASGNNEAVTAALQNLATSIGNVVTNISAIIPNILSGIVTVIKQLAENIDLSGIMTTIISLIPQVIELAVSIIKSFIQGLKDNINNIVDAVVEIAEMLINALLDFIPDLLQVGADFINSMITGLEYEMPILMPRIIQTIASIIDTIVSTIVNNLPRMLPLWIQMIQQFISTILTKLPDILQMGITLLITLIEGISETIPDMIPTIIEIVLQMVQTILDNLPMIIETSLQLIIALAQGLINAIPNLIEHLPAIIEAIVNTLISLTPQLVYAALQLIVALALGLIKAIPQLFEALIKIGEAIFDGIIKAKDNMEEAGKNLVEGLWNGLKSSTQWIKDKITGWVGDVVTFLKKLFGIASPSKVMEKQVGFNLGAGIANGIRDSVGLVEDAMDTVNGALTTTFNPTLSPSLTGLGDYGAGGISLSINMAGANISSPEVAEEYAEAIGDKIVDKLRTNRRSYG